MKKKMSPKEMREQEKRERQARFARLAEEKAVPAAAPQKQDQKPAGERPERTKKIKTKKSGVKISGVKSTWTLDDGSLLMASFGKGNAAVPEKYIDAAKNITGIPHDRSAFEVNARAYDYHVSGRLDTEGYSMDPRDSRYRSGTDMIGAKSALEREMFGRTFDDNIHVQLAYAVNDIKKLLAVHANNILFSLDNLIDASKYYPALYYDDPNYLKEDMRYDDIIGMGYISKNSYEEFTSPEQFKYNYKLYQKVSETQIRFENFIGDILDERHNATEDDPYVKKNPRLTYFPDAFYRLATYEEKSKKGNEIFNNLSCEDQSDIEIKCGENQREIEKKKVSLAPQYVPRTDKEIYGILGMISYLRQSCMHGKISDLFTLEKEEEKETFVSEGKEILSKIYSDNLGVLNSFGGLNAKNNFKILFQLENAKDEPSQINAIRLFYRFTILKEYKRLGVSIKLLRENLLSNFYPELLEDEFKLHRKKLNTFFDYLLWRYYSPSFEKESKEITEIVMKLRACTTDEARDSIYAEEAGIINQEISSKLKLAVELIRNISKEDQESEEAKSLKKDLKELAEKAIDTDFDEKIDEKISYFSKLIFLVTRFLDGKEINDLLTSLIHKFEVIASFIDVMNDRKIECEFTEQYALIEKSKTVAEELNEINGFARMGSIDTSGETIMFIDAAMVLGTNLERDELEYYLKNNVIDTNNLKKLSDGKPDVAFRRFVVNNVIKSSKFRYLVRYGNPVKVRKIMENANVIKFVLNDLPKEQINRYYEIIVSTSGTSMVKKINALTTILQNIRFSNLEEISGENSEECQELIGKNRTMISLYLNVMYQLLKNLVYINARYTSAFSSYESDRNLLIRTEINRNKAEYQNPNDTIRTVLGKELDGAMTLVQAQESLEASRKKCRDFFAAKGEPVPNGWQKMFDNEQRKLDELIRTPDTALNEENRKKLLGELDKKLRTELQGICDRICAPMRAGGNREKGTYDEIFAYTDLTKLYALRSFLCRPAIDDMARKRREARLYGLEPEKTEPLTRKYLELRWCKILLDNLSKAGSFDTRNFRNNADHLNTIRNIDKWIGDVEKFDSYFGLYQYFMQMALCEKNEKHRYRETLSTYHAYSKDFTKELCTPFGYNLPRYKNLSINELFDKNRPDGKKQPTDRK